MSFHPSTFSEKGAGCRGAGEGGGESKVGGAALMSRGELILTRTHEGDPAPHRSLRTDDRLVRQRRCSVGQTRCSGYCEERLMMRQHRSSAVVRRYIREGELFARNLSAEVGL